MAISSISQVVKGSDYIEPYDKDVVHKAFLYQQQQFDANVQKTQEGINQLASIDVIADEDKAYRDAAITGLTNKVNSMSGLDFSKSSTMNIINQAKQAITSDARLINAVTDTASIRKKQAHQQELIKKGQYSDANMWEDAQADIAYLNAKKLDPNARYQGSSFATPFKDVNKAMQTVAMQVAKLRASGHKQVPMTRQIINPDGTVGTVQQIVDISGISDQELSQYLIQSLGVQEQKQIAIDGRYKYRAATPESLMIEGTSAIANKYAAMKNRLDTLDVALKQSVKGSEEEKRYRTEIESLSKAYQDQIKTQSAQLGELIKTNPDAVKTMLHQDALASTYGSLYSNQSEKIIEDRPYYTEQTRRLNEKKYELQQQNQAFQQQAKIEQLAQGRERIRQGDESLEIRRQTLAANIADDQADNARADLKAGQGTGTGATGTAGTGGGAGVGANATTGVAGGAETKPITQSYADFKQEGIDLQQQEMDMVMSTLVDIAHNQDSKIFQNPELSRYLGLGQGNSVKLTGADGKIHPQVAEKLGAYFDRIGLTGIMPKMQRYYEEIARGGHPDTFATFKEYQPLANALATIKEKQKVHDIRDKQISRGAIEMLHKSVGSKLSTDAFARNIALIEKVNAKIGAYKPTAAESAKYSYLAGEPSGLGATLGKWLGGDTDADSFSRVNKAILLQNMNKELSPEGARKLGLTEKQRVEYNKAVSYYDRDIINQYYSKKNEYATTEGTGFSTTKTFVVPETESKKDTNTSNLLRTTIVTNPEIAQVRIAGQDAPLAATDERIANITGVRVLDHTVNRSGAGSSTAKVEITYSGTGENDKTKSSKYIATMSLPNTVLDNSQFRGGAARRNQYQDVIDNIDILGGRSEQRTVLYQSPNVKSPDPIPFVFERSPMDPKDNKMYLRVIVKDAKGNDIGFQLGGRSTPDELVANLNSQLSKLMAKGLSKQEALEALSRVQ